MNKQEEIALNEYRVMSRFKRIRHLEKIKELVNSDNLDDYWKLRGYLNLAKNHPIQALAAHICNYAALNIARKIKKYKIKAHIVLQVHDEITLYVEKSKANFVAKLLKEAMEDNEITRQMEVPIISEPKIGYTLAEVK